MAGKISGPAAAAVGAGALFAYTAIRGKSLTASIQALVQGKSPASLPQANPIADITAPAGGAAPPTANLGTAAAAASDAVRYAGAGFVWGGAPARGTGVWDCSSFANWVYGHDEGLAIPGYAAGTYTGVVHGPATLEWLAWSGAVTAGHDPAAAAAGDLAVWQTHMGICLGGGQMISALNSKLGTRQTSIAGGAPPGELLFVRRLR